MRLYQNRETTIWVVHVVILLLIVAGTHTPEIVKPAHAQDSKGRQAGLSKECYGADCDTTGDPIGGGSGYRRAVHKGDIYVADTGELLNALKTATRGQTIYIRDNAEIDLTGLSKIYIPIGVTIAGNRGAGKSIGPRIYTEDIRTQGLFIVAGPDVRITGIRFQGPDNEIRDSAYGMPNSKGIMARCPLEIDNCEISGWSHAAIQLKDAGQGSHIHHNYIHHNRRYGLGYGVSLDNAEALVEANIFDYNRHDIAGSGKPGTSYEARYNLVLPNGNGHSFDMHGGRDRKDGTDVAGTRINIHHNTVMMTRYPAVVIRGIPEKEAKVYNNIFFHKTLKAATEQYYGLKGNFTVNDNQLADKNSGSEQQ